MGRGKELLWYIGKKLAQFVAVLLVVSVLIFVMVRLSNIDPVSVILGGKKTSPETIAALRSKFNLDKPVVQQYFIWLGGMLRGDFGIDFKYQQPVWDLIAARLPVTLWLVSISTVLALVICIPLGVIGGVRQGTWADRASSLFSLVAAACPSFFLGVAMIAVVSRVSPGTRFTGNYHTFGEMMGRMWMPAICLALGMVALGARIIRTGMMEQMQSGYVQTARAKGLAPGRIVLRHAFQNAVIPFLTVMSIQVGSMLVGAVMVENVFSLAGVGGLLISAIQSSNYPVVQAITMILVFLFLLITTLVDILYAVIDPRIRVGKME